MEEFGPSELIKLSPKGGGETVFGAALQLGRGERHRVEVTHPPDRPLVQLIFSGSRVPGAVGHRLPQAGTIRRNAANPRWWLTV